MSRAAYTRGTRLVTRAADAAVTPAVTRADRVAMSDEIERLRVQNAALERDLRRARRCIAELRRSKDERMRESADDKRRSDLAISILCKRLFG